MFNGKYYSQLDGVAMGSPLGPTLANIFLCHHEEKWLDSCPKQFKCNYYTRYVDDIFCLFEHENQVNKFHRYLSSRHPSISFSKEIESDSSLSFLDIHVKRGDDEFSTSVYRKPTFSGLYLNFGAFAPLTYKKGLISCLLYRAYMICSNWELVHKEIQLLKCILLRNKYPMGLINRIVFMFLNKVFVRRPKEATVPKLEFLICLPFLGPDSQIVGSKLKKLFSSVFPAYKIKCIIKPGMKLCNLFNFKDKLSPKCLSHVVYKFSCGDCNITYIGKTSRHL